MTRTFVRTASFIIFSSLLLILSSPEQGAADEFWIGASCARSGPAKALGKGYIRGFNAYFTYLNQNGGVNGNRLTMVVKDDGYEPKRAVENTERLIKEDKVFMLTGYVGTPTSKVAVPVAEAAGVPFFFPFTGAEFLRNPVRPLVFNLRATYFMETEAMVRYLVDRLGLKRIALFYQDDSFGRAGMAGLNLAMKRRNMTIAGKAAYPRNTVAVKAAAVRLKKVNPDAIVMIGAYKPCAAFIKFARSIGLKDVRFINISFVGSKALAQELGADGNGVLITQVVPDPWDTSIKAVAEYQRLMKKSYPDFEPGFVSLEGFLAAKLLGEILKKAGTAPDRKAVLAAAEAIKGYDPGVGVTVSFSAKDHQGFEKVWLTMIRNGKIVPVNI